jgi:hypothetical protein
MGAIVLAGGSLTACSSEAVAPGHAVEEARRDPEQETAPPAPSGARAVALEILTGNYAVPVCNANPDPCCRFPDLPRCHADAGAEGGSDGACEASE